jgi:lipopolysaccharide transport system ATP-binding protein
MSSEVVISLEGICKSYPVFARPSDRLKQMIAPRFARALGAPVKKYYQEYWALRDIDCEIYQGESIGILGRNGAGKSTLLQIICGTLTQTAGSVQVKGKVAALLELGAGFNTEFTGRENVYLNSTILGLSIEQIEDRLDDILAFADIGEFIDQPVKTYSSGMYMRLAFSVAIHVHPEILVIDEALSVGDEAFQRKCLARIDHIRNTGSTILFVSHSASMVSETCDRAMLLDNGRLVAIGQARSVVAAYQKLIFGRGSESERVSNNSAEEGAGCESDVIVDHDGSEDKAYYDPLLDAGIETRYASKGARIENPRLFTLDGRRVNVLTHGRDYIYRYKVHFDSAAVGVRCGMMVKTLGGVELGGAATAPEGQGLAHVSPGESLAVSFRLRCLFLPGTYFLNAGLVAVEGEQEEYLDRRLDVVAFRVLPSGSQMEMATGYVDLGISAELQRA